MTIYSATIIAQAQALVEPADAAASGRYGIGMKRQVSRFAEVDQVWSCSVVGRTGSGDCVLFAGTVTGHTGGSQVGGDGLDPDGQTVAFSTLSVLHFRNTGNEPISISRTASSVTGVDLFGQLRIEPGGEVLFSNPGGADHDGFEFEILDADGGNDALSYEMTVFGSL